MIGSRGASSRTATSFGEMMSDFLRWDLLAGGLSLGLGIAAAGQAVQGNGSDELSFSVIAMGLLPVAVLLLRRTARRAQPWSVGWIASYAMYGGVRDGFDAPPWLALPVAAATCGVTVTVAGRIRSDDEAAAPLPGPDEGGDVGSSDRPDEASTAG